MTVTLGLDPDALVVHLSPGAVFAQEIVNQSGDWGVGDGLELRFSTTTPVVWTASIVDATARFDETTTEVDALLAAAGFAGCRVGLWYVNGDVEVPWALGRVRVAR